MTVSQPTRIVIVVDNKADSGLVSEHGFSAWIETAGQRLMFDTGQGPGLAYNHLWLEDVPVERTDALILSHGHYDHTGGIPMVLGRAPTAEVYIHGAAIANRYAVLDGAARSIAMPGTARMALREHLSSRVHWVSEAVEIAPGVGLTGAIPRVTDFEDTGGPFYLDSEGTHPDPIVDDLALWIRTGKGLVVVVGCSHAGVINTLLCAREQSGESRLHAVVGGFHLGQASEHRLTRTLECLDDLGLDLVVPCHCTGEAATTRLNEALGDRVVVGSAGMVFPFE